VSIKLSPNRPSAASTLSVTASGPFPQASGQLRSVELDAQRGFASSARSVASLCTAGRAADGACPAKSRVGGGSAEVTGTFAGMAHQDTLTFSLFLGAPQERRDIAAVVISGTDSLFHQSFHASGRLFKATDGSLELLFDHLPSYSLPPGTTVTLDRLSFTAHAVRTVRTRHGGHTRRTRYSLITNPPTCPGAWTSRLVLAFSDGSSQAQALSAPCSRS
jgi:hypothetical protein